MRLDPAAAERIREEVARAGGREVCFLAEVRSDGVLVAPRAVARGNHQAVVAAARDASPGEILLHNHPSGVLAPSDADLGLAARVYELGLGTGIVNNDATDLYVVIEPPTPRQRLPLEASELEALLGPGGALSARHGGYEDRPAQREMLREVTRTFNEGGISIIEAGTGTGKSLAYLLPAARWARQNGERTVVSTHTIYLQEQLIGKDLPIASGLLGGEVRWALVKGRGNYLSIRRLRLAAASAGALFEGARERELDALLRWSETTRDGSLSDLTAAPSEEVWEEVRSDGDICMGARCPHFQSCFYQRARREGAAADLLVVNHALLLSDVSMRRSTDNWSQSAVLPPYRHLVLDEGHNVEDAATSHLGAEVTRVGVLRALDRLERGGKGILTALLAELLLTEESDLPRGFVGRISEKLRPQVARTREAAQAFFSELDPRVPRGEEEPLRLGQGDPRDPTSSAGLLELLDRVLAELGRLRRELSALREGIEEAPATLGRVEVRLLDLQAIDRRLEAVGRALELVLLPGGDALRFVRWIEGGPEGPGGRNLRLAAAPVEPGELLRESLFRKLSTTIVTSATLSVGGEGAGWGGDVALGGSFREGAASGERVGGVGLRFLRRRLGLGPSLTGEGEGAPVEEGGYSEGLLRELHGDLEEPLRVRELLLSSPFDYPTQTRFCVPTGLPGHDAGFPFQEATAEIVRDLARITGGGIFVLFTSHRALRVVAQILRERGDGARWPLFVHGEAPRIRLVRDFVAAGNGILLGTNSFWEGVDVPGDPLRGLVLQKIPFRVPTEPVTQARMEAMERRGAHPFRDYLVPLAALRLKQGFGRLIRSRRDRGAILLLDSRILTRSYGRNLLRALPPAPLLRGRWEELRPRLASFYGCPPEDEG